MARTDSALLARFEQLRATRDGAAWKLLGAYNAPEILTVLYVEFFLAGEAQIPVARFHERLAADLAVIATGGRAMTDAASKYCADWVNSGWLDRDETASGTEESYFLTAEALAVLEIVEQLAAPTNTTTGSQINSMMDQLTDLYITTDPDEQSRIDELESQVTKLQAEIARLKAGQLSTTSDEDAAETVRLMLAQTTRSYADFARFHRGVRQAVRSLKRQAMASEASRGEIIEYILGQVDQLESTDFGRSFATFYQVLSDPVRVTRVEQQIDALLLRPFAKLLTPAERNALSDMLSDLTRRASDVHTETDALSSSLKTFVEQDRFSDERRIDLLAKDIYRQYSILVESISSKTDTGYALDLPTATVHSVGRYSLKESDSTLPPIIDGSGDPEFGDWDDLAGLADPDEINFAALSAAVSASLSGRSIVTIADVFRLHPDTAGLTGVIGLIQLGTAQSRTDPATAQVKTDITETVAWPGSQEFTIPRVSFFPSGAA